MSLQNTLRNIDVGPIARYLKIGMISFLVLGLSLVYLLIHFKGLGTEGAMDQAQIARSLISGEGFSTRYIRPLAIQQLRDSGKKIPTDNFPEFYNAPLYSLLEAAFLIPFKQQIQMTPADIISKGDRVIAFLGIVLLLLGVGVWYLVGLQLFDKMLALLSAALLLTTDLVWQYALAGLPQQLLLLLLGLVTLFALKAKESEEAGHFFPSLYWLGASSFSLGLMSLTHELTVFLLPGFLVFCLLAFHVRITALLLSLGIYLLTVSPWLIHNYLVCGNPFGLTIYLALAAAGVTESDVMRGVDIGHVFGGGLVTKIRSSLLYQAGHLWEYLGLNVAAVAFFFSFLHPFRYAVAASWRWIFLLMWVGMTLGMALFGVKETISANQLHIIFLPIFLLYGMAFLLVLWNRLNIAEKGLRMIFLTAVFLICAQPMIQALLAGEQARIQWPPYVPPFVTMLGNWFEPQEVLSSDMPWAVAWYAHRKCLLLPKTLRDFTEISDYGILGSSIVGLYLTPISGNESVISLSKGPYKEWGPLIMRNANLSNFSLKSFVSLPIDEECILYADSARWTRKKNY